MKLKSIRVKKYKLMRLYLAKYEAYKKSKTLIGSDIILDRLEVSFKKALFLIYQYHIYNKQILFIGVPNSTNKKFLYVLCKSNHIFLPRFVWKRGLLGNKESMSKKVLNFVSFKRSFTLLENPHLIVIFNEEKLYNIVPECRRLCIPILYFGSYNKKLEGVTYIVEGNFVSRKMKSFFQFLIYSILKKNKN